MIASDEPGYYLEGEFGIRLETDIESVVAQTKVKNKKTLKINYKQINYI
jgi:Xaa-Pro aminopeptidase